MSDAPEVNPAPAKTPEPHPLDALTGGAFSAATSGERAARVRDWLATQPSPEQLQEVFKELSVRDKGAARAIRERIDEVERKQNQNDHDVRNIRMTINGMPTERTVGEMREQIAMLSGRFEGMHDTLVTNGRSLSRIEDYLLNQSKSAE